jgi:hypothetical protein
MGKLAKVTEVGNCMSVQDVLRQSGTDWDVEVLPANVDTSAGLVLDGGYKALVRPDTNTALAFVGERYRTNRHRDQLYQLDTLVQSGDIVPVTTSMWDNGALLAYQFRCPNLDMTIHGRDIVSPLLTLAFSYGSQLADSAFFADFRWSCKNQLGAVASLNSDSRVKHRGDATGKFGELLQVRIGELGTELAERYNAMRRMTQVELSGRPLVQYLGEAIGASQTDVDAVWITPPDELRGVAGKIADVIDCYQVDDCGAEGTVWQAYNAVTRYETHKDGRTPESRQRRMLLGAGSNVAANAWTLASKIAA